jgi:hypothetical protein
MGVHKPGYLDTVDGQACCRVEIQIYFRPVRGAAFGLRVSIWVSMIESVASAAESLSRRRSHPG